MPIQNNDAASLKNWLHFVSTPGIGAQTARQLLARYGLPEQIFAQSHNQLSQDFGSRLASAILRTPTETEASAYSATLSWGAEPDNFILPLDDTRYPQRLLECSDPPPILYAKGQLAALEKPAVAIVGSRNASAQGLKNAEAFAHTLALHGLAIVSGLALGIDGAAHRGALHGATLSTIAVVGTGLDFVYPARHRALAHDIAAQGLLVSELPLGSKALTHHFPRRNRIISALSRGVLVIEAAAQSGSLITARQAAEQGREVFAIPGSIHSPLAKGCHALIKQGGKLVESAQDVLEELGLTALPQSNHVTPPIAEKSTLLDLMGHDPISLDSLQSQSGYVIGVLMAELLSLEMAGQIQTLADGRFQRVA